MFYDSKPKITCCSDTTLAPHASSEHDMSQARQSFDQFGRGPDRILCDSDPQLRTLNPIKNYNLGWGPYFLQCYHLLWFKCLTTSKRQITCCSDGTLVQYRLARALRLDRILFDSGQHCVDLSPLCRFEPHQELIILDGAQTLSGYPSSLVQTFQARQSFSTIWQWARYNSLWLGSTVEDLSPIKKLHFWIGPQLFTVTMFFGSHVLRMKAEHYTSSLQPSWLLPCGWVSSDTLDERAQKQLRTQSSLLFNGGAGCKVLDYLHLCRVCLQLYKLPSDVTKHGMQLPSTYEPLHCAAPVPVYACLFLCVDIVFWFSFCVFISFI